MRWSAALTAERTPHAHPPAVRRAIGLAVLLATTTAVAEPDVVAATVAEPEVAAAHRWPVVPERRALSLEDQIVERITQICNTFGEHLDLLSQDMFQLSVDGRKRRARIRFGGGDDQLLSIRFDGDIQFNNLNAQVDARIDLGFRGHRLRLELPRFHMQPAEYRGDYGVQIAVPVFVQRF